MPLVFKDCLKRQLATWAEAELAVDSAIAAVRATRVKQEDCFITQCMKSNEPQIVSLYHRGSIVNSTKADSSQNFKSPAREDHAITPASPGKTVR